MNALWRLNGSVDVVCIANEQRAPDGVRWQGVLDEFVGASQLGQDAFGDSAASDCKGVSK